MESVVNLISTVGFPIVCCIFMWRSYTTTLKDLTQAINDLRADLAASRNERITDDDNGE